MFSSIIASTFRKIITFLWPVEKGENSKIIPIICLTFMASFNYNILRTAKDALVVTAKGSGAEVIPFIKVWVLLPAALLFTYLYAKLSSKLAKEEVFYAMVGFFLSFFALFVFVLYPARSYLHPDLSADLLQDYLPAGFKGIIAIYRNWTFTAYYVMAELWGNIILSMLCWGFANQVSKVHEAERFYGIIGIFLNIAGILAGWTSAYVSSHYFNLPFLNTKENWEQTLIILISIVIVTGFVMSYLYHWMMNNPIFVCQEEKKKKKKVKMSLGETFSYLSRSPYLIKLALIVIAYNLVMNLVEVVWKGELKQMFPNPNDYNTHMGQVGVAMGLIATFLSLFVCRQSLKRFGWTFTASITPALILIASAGFFTFVLLKNFAFEATYAFIGASPLWMACLFGSAHNSLCRGLKYSAFDITKEIAFIPLSDECKIKGKAAIDGVASRFGKSGGSLFHQFLLMIFVTLTASSPYVALITMIAIIAWLYAVKSLGKDYDELNRQHSNIMDLRSLDTEHLEDENSKAV